MAVAVAAVPFLSIDGQEDVKVDGTSGTTRADSTIVGADAKFGMQG